MNNGTHPVLDKPKAVLAEAKMQYDSIKAKRDDMWQKLNSSTRESLERSIAKNPNDSPTSFEYFKPNDLGYSEFIKMVVFGKKQNRQKRHLKKYKKK